MRIRTASSAPLLLIAQAAHVKSFYLPPPRLGAAPPASVVVGRRHLPSFALYGRPVEYGDDYYDALGLTRSASSDEIRSAFRSMARNLHPDRFAEELRFDPSNTATSDLRSFLKDQAVGTAGIFERAELESLAADTHRRNGAVPAALEKRRAEVTDRFALVNSAYSTLYDEKARKMYDLSGEWGTGRSSGKSKGGGGTSTAADARRQRERAEAARWDSAAQQQRETRQTEERAEAAGRSERSQRRAAREVEDLARKIKWWEKETPEDAKRREAARAEENRADAEQEKEAEKRRKRRLEKEEEDAKRREAARVEAIQRNAERQKEERKRADERAIAEKKRAENERKAREARMKAAAETKVETQKTKRRKMEIEKKERDKERQRSYDSATKNSQDTKLESELQQMMKRYKLDKKK